MPNLGEVFPDFSANSTHGIIKFHEWLSGSWAVLFSHPADYTPVCTTELSRVVKLAPEFKKRGVKLIALSCDTVDKHTGWAEDVVAYAGESGQLPYPIIEDVSRDVAVKLGMIDPDEKDKDGLPLTARAVFIIGPDTKLKLSVLYPSTTGRNFDELLRAIDSLQLTATTKVATPVDWKSGDEVMVLPTVSDEEAHKLFPNGFRTVPVPSGKNYLRLTKDY